MGFDRAVEALGSPGGSRDGVRVATVGRQTAEEARRSGWRVTVIPETENAQGLLEALKDIDMNGAPVWIPSGNRPGSAGTIIPATLAERGAIAMSFPVYSNHPRTFSARELEVLNRAETDAVVLHSPSAVAAILGPRVPGAVGRWKGATMVSIGPSTTARARELGANQIIECETPSDQGVLDALAKGTV
jgi:uroporphyrinogen III methyltransferase/synthase